MTTRSGSCLCGQTRLASFRSDLLVVALLISLLGFASHTPARGATPCEQNAKEKPYALIAGTVWGPDSHPVYGVKVKVRRADHKKARWEQYSDHRGEFFQRLPAGRADYVVWADLKGYKSPVYKSLRPGTEVTVRIQNDERQDIGLHLTE